MVTIIKSIQVGKGVGVRLPNGIARDLNIKIGDNFMIDILDDNQILLLKIDPDRKLTISESMALKILKKLHGKHNKKD